MGKNLKRLKKPKREKVQNPVISPVIGTIWVHVQSEKCTYFPKSQYSLNKLMKRLRDEKKNFTTSKTK